MTPFVGKLVYLLNEKLSNSIDRSIGAVIMMVAYGHEGMSLLPFNFFVTTLNLG